MDLRFGIYSCAGTHTCEGYPASYGYEEIDAATFASWGVDFLKYDFCHTVAGSDASALYRRMGQALRSTGRDIVYSVCEWGVHRPWEWAASVGAHMWRTTEDIFDSWESVSQIGFDLQAELHPYAGPGRWNDPDMLVVGMHGQGHVGRGGLADVEYRSHFALWCLLSAPLMIGCDVRHIDTTSLELLGNTALIAIDQDPMGSQARRLGRMAGYEAAETWTRPLANGDWAVGFFNRGDRESAPISIGWTALGLAPERTATVLDVVTGERSSSVTNQFSTSVAPHDVQVLRISPDH